MGYVEEYRSCFNYDENDLGYYSDILNLYTFSPHNKQKKYAKELN